MKPEFDWKDAEWLISEWGDTGPVALKGVASGADAKKAVDTGFKAVWVSNHGGRQLEDSIATIDVVPEARHLCNPWPRRRAHLPIFLPVGRCRCVRPWGRMWR